MTPYEQRQTVEIFYKIFSKDPYNPKLSGVLPASKFVLDPMFQSVKQQFVEEFIVEDKPFILAGPEFNNLQLATPEGFEPPRMVLETIMLPLHQGALLNSL